MVGGYVLCEEVRKGDSGIVMCGFRVGKVVLFSADMDFRKQDIRKRVGRYMLVCWWIVWRVFRSRFDPRISDLQISGYSRSMARVVVCSR